MRTVTRLLLLLLPVGTALACGGRVDGIGPGGSCPAASGVVSGAACTSQGLSCPSTATDDCPGESGGAMECTCSGGAWSCPTTHGGCPQPSPQPQPEPGPGPGTCPVPGSLYDQLACAGDEGLSCPSDIPVEDCSGNVVGTVTCDCTHGAWSCPQPELDACPDSGPVDAGPPDEGPPDAAPPPDAGCPDPYSVAQGVACWSSGQICAGDPSWCDGQIDYDAFECVGGVWTDIARTVCAGEGGVIDAGPVDAGASD